jgi:hypothetical protein
MAALPAPFVNKIVLVCATEEEAVNLIMDIKEKLKNRFMENKAKQFNFSIYDNYINIEIKSFSSDNTSVSMSNVEIVDGVTTPGYLTE